MPVCTCGTHACTLWIWLSMVTDQGLSCCGIKYSRFITKPEVFSFVNTHPLPLPSSSWTWGYSWVPVKEVEIKYLKSILSIMSPWERLESVTVFICDGSMLKGMGPDYPWKVLCLCLCPHPFSSWQYSGEWLALPEFWSQPGEQGVVLESKVPVPGVGEGCW